MSHPDRTWIVVPAFNEGEVAGDVIGGLKRRYRNVVLVDDCSHDDTGDAALAAGAVVLRHPINLGQGAALQTGLDFALAQGAEFVVTFDADGQHRVEDIEALFAAQRATRADAVIGSRFLGAAPGLPAARRLVLRLAILLARLAGGIRLSDAHNGLRLLTRRAAAALRLTQNRMAHASEIVAQLRRADLAIAEAPVTILYTDYSLRKGQKIGNAFNIVAELIVEKLSK